MALNPRPPRSDQNVRPAPRSDAPAAATRPSTGAPQFSDDPVGALGFILSNIGAGFQGRELPSDQIAQDQLAARKFELETLRFGIDALSAGREHLENVAPQDLEAAATRFAAPFEDVLPGITQMLIESFDDPDTKGILDFLGENADTALQLCGPGNVECLRKIATDPDFVETVNSRSDEINRDPINRKFAAVDALLGEASSQSGEIAAVVERLPRDADGSIFMTVDQFARLNDQLPESMKLTKNEMGTLRRDEALQASLGIKLEETAVAEQLARIDDDDDRPASEQLLDRALELEAAGDFARAKVVRDELDKLIRIERPQLAEFMDLRDEARRRGNDREADEWQAAIDNAVGKKEINPTNLTQLQNERAQQEADFLAAEASGDLTAAAEASRRAVEIDDQIRKLNTPAPGRTEFDPVLEGEKAGTRRTAVLQAEFEEEGRQNFIGLTAELQQGASLLRQARSTPGAFGAKGAIINTLGGVVTQVLGDGAGRAFAAWVGDTDGEPGSPSVTNQTVAAISAKAWVFIGNQIEEITGEESGRFTEAERAITQFATALANFWKSPQQTVGALEALVGLKYITRELALIQSGMTTDIRLGSPDVFDTDGRLLIAGDPDLEGEARMAADLRTLGVFDVEEQGRIIDTIRAVRHDLMRNGFVPDADGPVDRADGNAEPGSKKN